MPFARMYSRPFLVLAEPEAPLGLDGAGGRVLDPLDERPEHPLRRSGRAPPRSPRRFLHPHPARTTCRKGRRSPRWAAPALPCVRGSARRPGVRSPCPPQSGARWLHARSRHALQSQGPIIVAHEICVFQGSRPFSVFGGRVARRPFAVIVGRARPSECEVPWSVLGNVIIWCKMTASSDGEGSR